MQWYMYNEIRLDLCICFQLYRTESFVFLLIISSQPVYVSCSISISNVFGISSYTNPQQSDEKGRLSWKFGESILNSSIRILSKDLNHLGKSSLRFEMYKKKIFLAFQKQYWFQYFSYLFWNFCHCLYIWYMIKIMRHFHKDAFYLYDLNHMLRIVFCCCCCLFICLFAIYGFRMTNSYRFFHYKSFGDFVSFTLSLLNP